MKAAFYTLGCKVNQYETQILQQLFAEAGYTVVSPNDKADLFVVNSCTVTASGDHKSRQALRRFKRDNPAAVGVLTGCFPQAFPDAACAVAEADVITGSANRAALPDAVRRFRQTGQRVVEISPHTSGEPFEGMQAHGFLDRTRAFVKIEDGCDRYCSYCIIPTARGPIRSKPLDALAEELRGLAASGYREIVLAGVNLSSYGKDCDWSFGLADAVELACALPQVARVRLGSLEPELLTDDQIARMAAQPKFCPQFHLSLQSGCDETLHRMNRHYTSAAYAALAERLHAAFPDATLTTDVIVGFPGETEEELEQSLAFVRAMQFAKVHIFPYSAREGTRAAKMPGQLPRAEKERRVAAMQEAVAPARAAFLQAQVGKLETVLFETSHPGLGQEGYTRMYAPVRVLCDADLRGQLRKVRIQSVAGDCCLGRLLDEDEPNLNLF